MNSRHVVVLAVVAVVAIATALWTTSVREPDAGGAIGSALVANLAASVNDVAAVHLYSENDEPAVTLRRGEASWQVMQKGGYRADTTKVRQLLLGLGDARLLEEKTSNPAYYERIGVQDVGDGANVRLVLEGVDAPELIIGDLASGRESVHVRRVGESTSWLASGTLAPSTDPLEWLDRDLIDIPASRIAVIEIVHPDGERLLASKAAFGQADFDIAAVPEGRELARANVAAPIAGALAGLRYDDVLPASDFAFPEEKVQTTLRTFDGLAISIELASRDDAYYARLAAQPDAATAQRFHDAGAAGDDAPTAASGTNDAADGNASEVPDPGATQEPAVVAAADEPAAAALDMGAAEAEAAALVARHAGWVYRLPQFRYEQLTRRLDDLLADPVEE